MKFLKTACLISLALLTYQCKSGKTSTSSKEVSANNDGSIPGSFDLAEAKKQWPNTSEETLKLGYTIYTTKCTKCHEMDKPSKRSEESWNRNIEAMAPKAKLTADEKEALTQYVLANKRANIKK